MSKYTTELRFICEMKSGFTESVIKQKSINEIVDASRANIFNFSYPIYDNTYKPTLEKKILKHYYTREIGAETYGLWHHWLDTTMNEIMPKYNKLYQAEHDVLNKELKNIDVHIDHLRTDDLLRESDFTRTDLLTETRNFTRTDLLDETLTIGEVHEDDTTFDGTSNSLNRNRYSDTPQGGIAWNDLEVNETQNSSLYLTDYRRIDDTQTDHSTTHNEGSKDTDSTKQNRGTQTNAGTIGNTGTQNNAGEESHTGTQDFDTDESGYRGNKVYAELLAEYSKNVLNIDMMIIRDLQDLFFKLW